MLGEGFAALGELFLLLLDFLLFFLENLCLEVLFPLLVLLIEVVKGSCAFGVIVGFRRMVGAHHINKIGLIIHLRHNTVLIATSRYLGRFRLILFLF